MTDTATQSDSSTYDGVERRHHVHLPPIDAPRDPAALLEVDGFGVAFGKKVILCELSFSVAERGATVLLGPSGTGKSTLLRTLAGLSSANPSLRTWGSVYYRGNALYHENESYDDIERPELVAQSAQLMMSSVVDNVMFNLPESSQITRMEKRELAQRLLKRAGLSELVELLDEPVVGLSLAQQRHLAILRLAASGPHLLCIDEPTTGLNETDSIRLLKYIKEESERRAVLVVLHNQQHARMLGGEAVLMAGGYVQERQPIPQIFEQPQSRCGREFARNGTCAVASPDANPEDLDESIPPPPPLPIAATRNQSNAAMGPRGFLWLRNGRLAGTPVPGVYFDMEYDLKALQKVGITKLLTLTETELEADKLTPFGISAVWEPIPDMQAPSIEQGIRICKSIDQMLAQNEVIAVHCRAGLGRTGTVLAAHLIWEGHNALDALETVRSIEPRWVQSQEQVDFLEEFAGAVANERHR